MKVSDINLSMRDLPARPIAEKQEQGASSLSFHRNISELSEASYRVRIDDLIGAINKQGEIVAKRADIKELQKYREMITELLHETVSNNYVFTKNSAFDSRGRHRIYSMIKKVNTKLDDLAQDILKEQSENIDLLDRVDDIRGLLVDMFL